MASAAPKLIEFYHWDRKILNAYWIIILLVTAAVSLLQLIEYQFDPRVILGKILLPIFLMSGFMGSAELALLKKFKYRHYLFILCGTVFAIILIFWLPFIHGIQLTFAITLFGSMSYYDKKKVLFSFAVNLLSFLLLYLFLPSLHKQISLPEFIATLSSLGISLFVIFSILGRGIELHQNLMKTMKKQQDLLVQNIMMEKLNKIDALTELYNHKTFHEFLDRLVEQADTRTFQLQVALLDIDNFKHVNDRFGHWAGDIVLKRFSGIIANRITSNDFAARYGGEEFAIIFTDKSLEDSLRICEKIRLDIAQLPHEELNGDSVSVSIGLQEYKAGQGKERLFKGADIHLYECKRTGKNKTLYG